MRLVLILNHHNCFIEKLLYIQEISLVALNLCFFFLKNTYMTEIYNYEINSPFEKKYSIKKDTSTTRVGDNVIQDIELLSSFSTAKTIASTFENFLYFDESKVYLHELLSIPTTKQTLLRKRQHFIESIKVDTIQSTLSSIREKYHSICWIFTKKSNEVEDLLNTVYFSWYIFKHFNSSSNFLKMKTIYNIAISPIVGILSPVIYCILPYLILTYKFKIKIKFKTYIQLLFNLSTQNLNGSDTLKTISYLSWATTVFFYFNGMLQSIDYSKQTTSITKLINTHMTNLLGIYEDYKTLLSLSETDSNGFYNNIEPVIVPCFDSKAHSSFGYKLKLFKNLSSFEDAIKIIMNQIFLYDSFQSIKNTIEEKNLSKTWFFKNDEQLKPCIEFKNIWHINLDKPVQNSISNKCEKSNIILSGPNAAGKSTFLKAVLINIMLSQTIGYSACSVCKLTPYNYIASQINVPDCTGKESLFEAEMYRCKLTLDYVFQNPLKNCIVFMDEIFNSTNMVEGVSGAFAILKSLGTRKNCNTVISTHFPYLSKLHKSSSYNLYKFDAIVVDSALDTDTLKCCPKYSYKLSRGFSTQYIALDILRFNGYDSTIINEATEIRNHILDITKI